MKKVIALLIFGIVTFSGFSQDEKPVQEISNIQEYTPSKLLNKGQWDIKFFNSLYTQKKRTDGGNNSMDIPRESFFTSTTEIYTGISNNSRINIGFIFQIRSNTFGGADALAVFKFENNLQARSGLTTIAPSIRVQPFASVANFSFTSSVYLPIFEDKAVLPYLDKRSVFWETKFFYDKTFGGNKWQVFTEVDLGFNFGEKSSDANPIDSNVSERFANNSLFLPFSAFLSYFPSPKTTVFVNVKQAFLIDLGNDFAQNSTSLGFGGKYQMSDVLNIEASFDKFVRGQNFQGLGQTFSVGLRALF
jgi:hypothetical protein